MEEKLSRRSFIGGAALGSIGLTLGVLTGCAPKNDRAQLGTANSSDSPTSWDQEVDLLICGGGGCGMACAVEAKDNGVENILVVEKGNQLGGTTSISQGLIAGFETQFQKKQGIEISYEDMYANLMNNASYRLDPELTKITVENCGKTIDWLADRVKVPFTDNIVVAYGPLQMMHNVDGAGGGLASAFSTALDEAGVSVQKDTKLVEILLNNDGAVEGAVVETKGKIQHIKTKSIMLATGGYANNPELTKRFDPEKAGTFGIGHPNSEGDGLVAASNIGALLSHTNSIMCVLKDYTIMNEHNGTSASASLHGFTNLANMILVGSDGKRFTNEKAQGYMSQDLNGPIFDKMHRDNKGYVWMISDETTVASSEKTIRGENLEYIKGTDAIDLANNINVNPTTLAQTIDAYNVAVDTNANININELPTAALVPPYLAVPVVPCEIITYGGIARNSAGEVLKADGTPIPGLFTGGEASCNSAYMGFTLSNCFTWGRIGAQSAAAYIKS